MNINKAIVEKVISLAKKHQQTYQDFYNKHPDEIGFPLDEKYKSTSEYRQERKVFHADKQIKMAAINDTPL